MGQRRAAACRHEEAHQGSRLSSAEGRQGLALMGQEEGDLQMQEAEWLWAEPPLLW